MATKGSNMTAADESDRPVRISTERARSGETSGHVRLILIVSVTLTIVALGAVLGWWMLFE